MVKHGVGDNGPEDYLGLAPEVVVLSPSWLPMDVGLTSTLPPKRIKRIALLCSWRTS
jgi:hypothetical protein